MFCKHCGKELAEEAIMCPNCGTPTNINTSTKKINEVATDKPQSSILATLSFILAMIGTGASALYCLAISSYFEYNYYYATAFVTVLGILTVMLVFAAFIGCLTSILKAKQSQQNVPTLSIVGFVFSSVSMLLLLVLPMIYSVL